jgi:hypothetical protein
VAAFKEVSHNSPECIPYFFHLSLDVEPILSSFISLTRHCWAACVVTEFFVI